MGLRWLLGFVGAGSLLVPLMAGCGGGDGDFDTRSVDPEAAQLLAGMMLTADDLPAGLQQASALYSTNEDLASAFADREAALARLEGFGRRLGYDVQFEPVADAEPDLPVKGLQITVSLYRTSSGAETAFTEGVADARESDWAALYPGVRELEVEELQRPGLAEEAVWFRISGFDERGGLLLDDQVAFRVGPVRGFVRSVTAFSEETERDLYLDQVESWVRAVAGRMQGVAEATPGP